jgi:cytochrome c oxidase subunit 2
MNKLPEASAFATRTDQLFFDVFMLSLAFLVFITALMIYFVIRYSKKRHPKAEQIEGHTLLEITWTVVPLLLFIGIFYFGWTGYDYSRRAPRDAMVVKVTGRQWKWSFQYPNGKQTDKLYAVLNRPLKLDVNSLDILHGFFIPAFRLKADAVPGRTNTVWFQPTRLGTYDIQCTVICGVNHSDMLSQVKVVREREFKAWYFGPEGAPEPTIVALNGSGPQPEGVAAAASAAAAPPASVAVQAGTPLLASGTAVAAAAPEHSALAVMRPRGCLGCHSIDGKPMVGPTFRGLYGKREQVVTADGATSVVTMDDARLRLAIVDPAHEIVRGYPPRMPKIAIGEDDLNRVVAYIKDLK